MSNMECVMQQQEIDFLVGLAKLTRETGIAISGCGCCGSPSIEVLSAEELADPRAGYGYGYAGEVSWLAPSNQYRWERFAGSIVRSVLSGVKEIE